MIPKRVMSSVLEKCQGMAIMLIPCAIPEIVLAVKRNAIALMFFIVKNQLELRFYKINLFHYRAECYEFFFKLFGMFCL